MASDSGMRWTPIMMITSLFAFFFAVSLLSLESLNVLAEHSQGRLVVFFFFLILSLVLSWGAFINALRQFRYYDDKRWAWFYCIFTDLTATLITVTGLYSIFSILTVISGP